MYSGLVGVGCCTGFKSPQNFRLITSRRVMDSFYRYFTEICCLPQLYLSTNRLFVSFLTSLWQISLSIDCLFVHFLPRSDRFLFTQIVSLSTAYTDRFSVTVLSLHTLSFCRLYAQTVTALFNTDYLFSIVHSDLSMTVSPHTMSLRLISTQSVTACLYTDYLVVHILPSLFVCDNFIYPKFFSFFDF